MKKRINTKKPTSYKLVHFRFKVNHFFTAELVSEKNIVLQIKTSLQTIYTMLLCF